MVIDSEAANPSPEDIAQISNCRSASEHPAPSDSSPSKQLHFPRAASEASLPSLSLPSLELVVGCWWDAKESYYEVTFDEGTTASCHVKTTRPGGVVRETKALIRAGQVRGKQVGRILWGSAFILELPVTKTDQLEWRSIRGGKDFSWMRQVEKEQPHELATEPSPETVSAELHAQLGSQEQAEPKPAERAAASSREKADAEGKRRVWRAVHDKQAPRSTAQSKGTSKTPSEVASAPRRHVQARSGEWRVIDKNTKPSK